MNNDRLTRGGLAGFSVREWSRCSVEAFPYGEGGRAQRGRMRSFPGKRRIVRLSLARFPEVALIFRFQRGRTSSPARKLCFFLSFLLCCCVAPGLPRHPCAGANAAPAPAQGASPLDPFPLARSRGVERTCRFHRGMRGIPPGNSLGLIGCAWAAAQTCAGANAAPAPAQGVSPLDPFPLRVPLLVGRKCGMLSREEGS